MSGIKPQWLSGNLPTWIATGLLGILCWGGNQYFDHLNAQLKAQSIAIEENRNNFVLRESRFISLEEQNHALREIVNDLKTGQKELLQELRLINANLRK